MRSGGAHLDRILRRIRLLAFDFDGVFTDNTVWVGTDGSEWVRCSRADGLGVARLRAAGLRLVVLSSEVHPVVAARCRKLAIDCHQGLEDKVATLAGILAQEGLSWEQAAFVGNDVNDAPCLERVALPIVVDDAHPDVSALAAYRTHAPGGRGAVREVCDLLLRASEPSSG